ncbi:MAG: TIGR01620 family protein [Pseudomonadota bacterium]|nr:TIGR01620 family protein [Pseudomonadota bacterium]
MSDYRPRPRAFRLDDSGVAYDDRPAADAPRAEVRSETAPIPDHAPEPLDEGEREIETAQASGMARRWRPTLSTLAWTGLGGLVSLGVGLWVDDLITALWAKAQGFGWLGVGFAALLIVGVLGLAAREFVALMRQRRIAQLHADLAQAHARDDRALARASVGRLMALYRTRPQAARALAEVARASGEIIDGRDLVEIAERALVKPLDARARAQVAAAARRVSLVTALSPRAVLDVVFVAAQVIRLTREIAEIYGGRPGLLGFLKLARSISAHLVITGGMAVGDTVLQGLVGHGIAAKLSSRMGEGVLNGLLTTRVGVSAMAVCRPAPFHAVKPPSVNDVAPFLFGGGKA